MSEELREELLGVEEVAAHLGVGRVTVHRWCRDGRLPCFKVGRLWRIKREGLEDFVERSEGPRTLAGRLRSFFEVPDNVLAVARSQGQLYRLDAAFFAAGEARGGVMVKYHSADKGGADLDDLRAELERSGLEAGRLERAGRLRFLEDREEPGERVSQIGRLLSDLEGEERSIWVAFNWERRVGLEEALEQQSRITEFVEGSSLVVETAMLEDSAAEGVGDTPDSTNWPAGGERRAQLEHTGTIWLSNEKLLLSRAGPPPD